MLVRWDPDVLLSTVFDQEETRSLVRHGLLAHRDWIELDRGTLEPADAVTRAAERTPQFTLD